MNHTMTLTIQRVEGALIRALGLIERRGFAVTSIDASADEAAVATEPAAAEGGADEPPTSGT